MKLTGKICYRSQMFTKKLILQVECKKETYSILGLPCVTYAWRDAKTEDLQELAGVLNGLPAHR